MVNTVVNAALIVSVRTKVPLTIATPITIANAVRDGAELPSEKAAERDPGHD